jgi:hypothetical protein
MKILFVYIFLFCSSAFSGEIAPAYLEFKCQNYHPHFDYVLWAKVKTQPERWQFYHLAQADILVSRGDQLYSIEMSGDMYWNEEEGVHALHLNRNWSDDGHLVDLHFTSIEGDEMSGSSLLYPEGVGQILPINCHRISN